MNPSLLRFWQTLGPGLLFAGTAVGVSHLVQSTRAGAGYGLSLVWLVLLANLFKYPAFEAGSRYAAGTGRSLLDGYKKLGNWAVGAFLLLTLATMVTVLAAVTLVTAGLLATLIPLSQALVSPSLQPTLWSGCLLVGAYTLLAVGQFRVFEWVMKTMVLVLSASTLCAVLLMIPQVNLAALPLTPLIPSVDKASLVFFVGLVGWMPSAIDIAVWHSLWTVEKNHTGTHKVTPKGAFLDFNIGYIGTTLLALCFLVLGAATLYGSGTAMPQSGIAFAATLIDLYATALGDWARPVILVAALATMLSTTLTVCDGFPRALQGVWHTWSPNQGGVWVYWLAGAVCSAGALVVISRFSGNQFAQLIDLATTLTCLTAPGLALLNWLVLHNAEEPEVRPSKLYTAFHISGIVFLTLVALAYLWMNRLPDGMIL